MKQTIEVGEEILSDNNTLAGKNRKKLSSLGIFSVNVMASPGAGKTSLILETIAGLSQKYRIGVIDGDVVEVDVARIKAKGVPVVLANTGGACHLDAVMVEKALQRLNLKRLELLIIENVGNLICPANFALGNDVNVVVASVPEGDDKPEKYPGMFKGADVVLLNKSDYLAVEEFNVERFRAGVKRVNSEAKVLELSCRTKEGVKGWLSWLEAQVEQKKV